MPMTPASDPVSMNFAAGLDIASIGAQITQLMAGALPELAVPAQAAVDRVASDKWALEWQLSRLLGEAYGLQPETIEALTVGAVLGLCAIRSMDDLTDDHPEKHQASRVALSSTFYTQALLQYMHLFDSQAGETRGAFMEGVNQFMSQWARSALVNPDEPFLTLTRDTLPATLASDAATRLSWRGAPLKIGVLAVCLLAGCDHRLPNLTRALDRAMLALVLLDHFIDWEDDLAMSRANVYVAHVSPGPQNEMHVNEHRLRVMQKTLDTHGNDVYFEAIAICLADALAYAEQTACPKLCSHVRALTHQVEQYAQTQDRTASALLRAAAALMFDDPDDANGTIA